MRRRDFLKAAAATSLAAPSLAAPSLALGAEQRVMKFTPQADLSVLDPVWTTATVTRNHAFLVFDTLYGQDDSYRATPQMAEGATTENGRQVDRSISGQASNSTAEPARYSARIASPASSAGVSATPSARRLPRGDRRTLGARRQDHPVPLEAAVSAASRRARQMASPSRLRSAPRAHRQDRRLHASDRDGRQWAALNSSLRTSRRHARGL